MRKVLIAITASLALCACDKKTDSDISTRQCGGYQVEMTFNDQGDAMHAIINGDEMDLTLSVSASGAKYDGVLNDTNVTLWQKGDEWTMILDDDMVIECDRK